MTWWPPWKTSKRASRRWKPPRPTTVRFWPRSTLGANQRQHALGLADVTFQLTEVKSELAEFKIDFTDFGQETRATFRSVDEQLAEIKDLLIGRRQNGQ